MIDYQDGIAYYDRAFDAFNKANKNVAVQRWQYTFGRVEHLVDLEKIDQDYHQRTLLNNPDIKMLNDLNWLFIKQPDSKIWQDAHYAVKKHANTIIIKFLNRELNFNRFQTLDAHLITTDLSQDSKTAKFIVFKDRLDLWLSEINPDSEYTLCKEIENDRIAQWIVRTSDLKMMKAGTDLNSDTDLGLYFIDHPDTQLVDLYRHILDLLK